MDDWKGILKDSVTTPEALSVHFPDVGIDEIRQVVSKYPMRINPYFMEVIKTGGAPAYNQAIPDPAELNDTFCPEDPLCEEKQSPVPNLTHRYPNRCLLLVSSSCAMYCRFCTRKRKVGDPNVVNTDTINAGIEYIKDHPDIKDVILSGGDPLLLEDERIDDILGRLRAIPHVEILRIGTRVPCVLPQRVTARLARILKRYHPIYVNVHFNHPCELTDEARAACARLADSGIPLNNQTVLLRGVNDNVDTLRTLFQQLLTARIRPYYLYQTDVTRGTNHFRTSVETGLDIMRGLRGYCSGLAVPYFIIDAPAGGGKVPVIPKYVVRRTAKEVVMRNYRNEIYRYPEVQHVEENVRVDDTSAIK